MKKRIISCVHPNGRFLYGIHKPQFLVKNLRDTEKLATLGELAATEDSPATPVDNNGNYPHGDITVQAAHWVYEVPNPFPFRGRTFICKEWADGNAGDPSRIRIPVPEEVSLSKTLRQIGSDQELITALPTALQLALATTSTDSEDLVVLAKISCELIVTQETIGLKYENINGRLRPIIHNHLLFEAVANNPHLPDEYKIAMVIRPGAQGASEIVGEWQVPEKSHIYEYLRRNSYIAGGHYAANMAEDAIRYATTELKNEDIAGLRHLYYQRSFIRLAAELDIPTSKEQRSLDSEELESLRKQICAVIAKGEKPVHTATLWGWNFGFDYAPSRYRLHASHQQIHQQYALLPETVSGHENDCETPCATMPALPTYGCGDLVAAAIEEYRATYNSEFFNDYISAIRNNTRMDKRNAESSLIVWEDDNVLLFVPKAQTSQWELQIMTLPDKEGKLPGNIVECNPAERKSLDTAILLAQQALAALGAQMVTSIEFPKRIGTPLHQPLLYSLLPRLPESPGAFSEAQLRFINGHYPEDFAMACRNALQGKEVR